MSCEKSCEKEKTCITNNNSCDYLIIIVLYILLAIILSACLFR